MKSKLRAFIELWDIPGGSILGIFTLVMIAESIAAFVLPREIPTSVISIYQFVVASFAGSKAVSTIWGKPLPPKDTPAQ